MGGVMKTARKVIDPMNIMDPGGILPGPKGGKYGTPSWQSNDAKKKTSTNKYNQSDAIRAQIFQMMKDRQAQTTKQLQNMPTALNAQQAELQKQQDAQTATQPTGQAAQPIGQVDQNATNAILNPTPAVTPTTTSSVAAPTQAMVSPTAPLANEYTGMGQQKTNQFSMPSTSGLKFGGT